MFRLSDQDFSQAKQILRDLIRIDTTNPPGNEKPAADFLAGILKKDGIDFQILEKEPGRANLVARLKGSGENRPLMLSSHLDVVPADAEKWTHPPFSGEESGGCIWGRGAIDMKGFAVMALTVFRKIKAQNLDLKRDLIFTAVADEEAGCKCGSNWLASEHPELVRAEYVINEVGGFNVDIEGRRFYLVQTAERGTAWLRLRIPGTPGHSSLPAPNSCLAEAADVLKKLTGARLPHHVTGAVREVLGELASQTPKPIHRAVLRGLERPLLGKWILHTLVPAGRKRQNLQAALSNTANPTIVSAGSKINVLPSEVIIDIDGRTVPGCSAKDLAGEIRSLIGNRYSIEILRDEPGVAFTCETPFFDHIRAVLNERDPEAGVLPHLTAGFTDSHNWAKLGATCYGFYPLRLPEDLDFAALFHGIDERIPVEGFRFGIETLYDLVKRVSM